MWSLLRKKQRRTVGSTCPGLARAPAGEWLRAQAGEWLEPAPFLRVVPTDSLYLFDFLWKECQF